MENLLDFSFFCTRFLLPCLSRPPRISSVTVVASSTSVSSSSLFPLFSPSVTLWPSPRRHKKLCGIINCPLCTYSNSLQCLMMAVHMNNFSDLHRARWRLFDTSDVCKEKSSSTKECLQNTTRLFQEHFSLYWLYLYNVLQHFFLKWLLLCILIITTCFGKIMFLKNGTPIKYFALFWLSVHIFLVYPNKSGFTLLCFLS